MRYLPGIILFAGLWPAWSGTVAAQEAPAVPEAKLKPFRGRWSTARETRADGKVRPFRVILEFRGGELTVYAEEGGKKGNQFTLQVLAVEEGKDAPYLVLDHGGSKYVISYDFVGERLILLGRLVNRPFEGFSLSGDYQRIEKPD